MNMDIPDKALGDAVRSALLGDHRHDAPLAGVARETLSGLMPQIEARMRDVASEFLASADFAAQVQRGAGGCRAQGAGGGRRRGSRAAACAHCTTAGRGLFDGQHGVLEPSGMDHRGSRRRPGAPYTQPTDAAERRCRSSLRTESGRSPRGRASQAGPSSGPQSKPAGFDQRRRVCAADAVHGPAGALTSGCPGVSGSSERGHRRVSAVAGVSLDIRAGVGARADAGRLEATEDQGCEEEQRPASARFFPRAVRQ